MHESGPLPFYVDLSMKHRLFVCLIVPTFAALFTTFHTLVLSNIKENDWN